MADENLIFYLITFALAFFVTGISVRTLIPILKRSAKQPIYEHIARLSHSVGSGNGLVFDGWFELWLTNNNDTGGLNV